MIGFQDFDEWPVIKPLPSYGRGRDNIGGRYTSFISGTNLTDVIITGIQKVLLCVMGFWIWFVEVNGLS